MPENKVKFGLKNVHYAVLTPGEDGGVSLVRPKNPRGGQFVVRRTGRSKHILCR